MHIVFFSDSHGNIHHVEKIIRYAHKTWNVNHFIFLGDGIADIQFIQKQSFAKDFHFESVLGNCDNANGTEKIITVDKVKILITHGDKYAVKYNLDKLIYKAMEENVKIALYGHTHIPKATEFNHIILANPGSCKECTQYGLLEIEGEHAYITLMNGVLDDIF